MFVSELSSGISTNIRRVASAKKYALETSCTISRAGGALHCEQALHDNRNRMYSTGGVAANKSGLANLLISFATIRKRYCGSFSSWPAHLNWISSLPVSNKHWEHGTFVQTFSWRTSWISSSLTKSARSSFPLASSQCSS